MPVRLQGRVSAQEPGAAVRCLARLADRPSERRLRGRGCGEVVLRDQPGWWMAFQAPGNGSETAEQGVLRAQYRSKVTAVGREPERPAPPSPRVARHREVIRVGEMVSGEVVSLGRGER
jgi:hypothetical protein